MRQSRYRAFRLSKESCRLAGASLCGLMLLVLTPCTSIPAGANDPDNRPTATPIKHQIVVVGENHTFDNHSSDT
jgi:hypothetical protein